MRKISASFYGFLFSKAENVLAASTVFIKSGFFVVVTIYANTLFLSAYPPKLLPYFYSIQAFFEALFTFILLPVIQTKTNRVSILLTIAMMVISFLLILVLSVSNIYWIAFSFSIFLIVCDNIIFLLTWTNIRLAFDTISFKKTIGLLRFAGYSGSIIFGAFIFLILHFFNYNILPWIIIILLLPLSICFYYLKPIVITKKMPKYDISIFKYEMIKKVFIYALLFALCNVLVDYCLKYKLSISLDTHHIADFMASYVTLIQILNGIFSSILIVFFIHRFPVNYLLIILPGYWLVTTIGVMIHPSLWAVAIMATGSSLLPLTYSGIELLLSILPGRVQIKSRFIMQLFILLCTAVTIPLIFLFTPQQIQISVFIVLCLSIILIYIAYKIKFSYVSTLKKEIQHKRFYLSGFIPGSVTKESNLAAMAVKDTNPESVQFGLSLLSQSSSMIEYDDITHHIQSKYSDIKIETIKIIINKHNVRALPFLFQQFLVEQDDEVIWWLYCAICNFEPERLLEHAKRDLNSEKPGRRAGAIFTYLTILKGSERDPFAEKLIEMINHDSPTERKYAAYILESIIAIDDPIFESLNKDLLSLIKDTDYTISIEAIHAAIRHKQLHFVPVIVNKMANQKIDITELDELAHLGEVIIPDIKKIFEEKKNYGIHAYSVYIKLLALIPGESSEIFLLNLCSDKNMAIRSLAAKEIAHRIKMGFTRSSSFDKSLKKILNDELSYIHMLHSLKTKTYLKPITHAQLIVERECASRLAMAEERFLYYLSTLTRVSDVLEIIPTILEGDRSDRGKGLELLMSYYKDRTYIKMIENVFVKQIAAAPVSPVTHDDWIETVIKFMLGRIPKGPVMDKLEKVFILRSTELFRKLPAEILVLIAEEIVTIDVRKGQTIFSQGDISNGLYIIASGEVDIIVNRHTINTFKRYNFFGELGLLDNEVRTASTVAKTDLQLLFLGSDAFNRLIDDVPEVLRSITQTVLRYLRSYIKTYKNII